MKTTLFILLATVSTLIYASNEKKLVGTCPINKDTKESNQLIKCQREIAEKYKFELGLGKLITEYNLKRKTIKYYIVDKEVPYPEDLKNLFTNTQVCGPNEKCTGGDTVANSSLNSSVNYEVSYNSLVSTAYALGPGAKHSCRPNIVDAHGRPIDNEIPDEDKVFPKSVDSLIETSTKFVNGEVEQSKIYRESLHQGQDGLSASTSTGQTQEAAMIQQKENLEQALKYLVGIDFTERGNSFVNKEEIAKYAIHESRVKRRLELWKGILTAQQLAQGEHLDFLKAYSACTPLLRRATRIANRGCKRTKTKKVCDADKKCTNQTVPHPVPGSCDAVNEIPVFYGQLAYHKETYDRVMPSRLQKRALTRIENRYRRLVKTYLTPGKWSGPVQKCYEDLKKMRVRDGVICYNFREDGFDEEEWGLDPFSNPLADFYEVTFGRKANDFGYVYLKKYYDKEIKTGKSSAEVIAKLKHMFNNHKTADPKAERDIKLKVVRGIIRGTFCASNQKSADGICRFKRPEERRVDTWDISKRVKRFREEAKEYLLAVVEGEHNTGKLVNTHTRNWNLLDLYIGQSGNRFMPLESLEEQVTQLNKEDIAKSYELLRQRNELLGLINNMRSSGYRDTARTNTNSIQGSSFNFEQKESQGTTTTQAGLNSNDSSKSNATKSTSTVIQYPSSSPSSASGSSSDIAINTSGGNSAGTLSALENSIQGQKSALAKGRRRILTREKLIEKDLYKTAQQATPPYKNTEKKKPNFVKMHLNSPQWINRRSISSNNSQGLTATTPGQQALKRNTRSSTNSGTGSTTYEDYTPEYAGYDDGDYAGASVGRGSRGSGSSSRGYYSDDRNYQAIEETIDYLDDHPNYEYTNALNDENNGDSIFSIITNRYLKNYHRVHVKGQRQK